MRPVEKLLHSENVRCQLLRLTEVIRSLARCRCLTSSREPLLAPPISALLSRSSRSLGTDTDTHSEHS